MKTIKFRKFYRPSGFLRASSSAERLFRLPLLAISIMPGYSPVAVAWCRYFTTDAHGIGVPKEFARRTAGIPPARLVLMATVPESAIPTVIENLTRQLEQSTQLSFNPAVLPIPA